MVSTAAQRSPKPLVWVRILPPVLHQNMLSVMERIRTYLQEVLKELQKVSWPTREQLIESTIVVTVAILLVSFLTFAADSVISLILENFYKFFS